jgi:hypothetical protein
VNWLVFFYLCSECFDVSVRSVWNIYRKLLGLLLLNESGFVPSGKGPTERGRDDRLVSYTHRAAATVCHCTNDWGGGRSTMLLLVVFNRSWSYFT